MLCLIWLGILWEGPTVWWCKQTFLIPFLRLNLDKVCLSSLHLILFYWNPAWKGESHPVIKRVHIIEQRWLKSLSHQSLFTNLFRPFRPDRDGIYNTSDRQPSLLVWAWKRFALRVPAFPFRSREKEAGVALTWGTWIALISETNKRFSSGHYEFD